MSVLTDFLQAIYGLFKIEMDIYGFTISFWDILMFSLVVGLLFKFIGGVLNEN